MRVARISLTHTRRLDGRAVYRSILTAAAVMGLFIAVSGAAGDGSLTADELLRRVSARYDHLDAFQFEGREVTVTRSGSFERKTEQSLMTAADGTGRLRLEFDNSTISGVALYDGEKSWLYLPSFGQYNVRYGDTLPDAGDGNVPVPDLRAQANRYPARYKALDERLTSARLIHDEDVLLEGRTISCAVVEADYDPPPGVSKGEIRRTLWIDPKEFLVLRERSVASSHPAGAAERIIVTQDVDFSVVRAGGRLPADLFEFEPPESAVAVSQFGRGGTANKVAAGTPAGDFTLSDLDGKAWTLSELRGKTVLLDFWATWCMPCRVDMPHIESLHQEFKNRSLVVLGVNSEDAGQPRAFLSEQGYTFPTLIDPGNAVARQFQVQVIPTMVVIAKDGTISDFLIGSQAEETLRTAVVRAGAAETE